MLSKLELSRTKDENTSHRLVIKNIRLIPIVAEREEGNNTHLS